MKLNTQIALGYTSVLSVSIFGTLIGLAIGDRYQEWAFEEREKVARERNFLTQLQVDILYKRPEKQLAPHLQNPDIFETKSNAFIRHLKKISENITQYQSDPFSSLNELDTILAEYQRVVDRLIQKSEAILPTVRSLSRSPQNRAEAEFLLLSLVKSEELIQFIEFIDRLIEFNQILIEREKKADETLRKAHLIRDRIIIVSLGLSIAVASVLASSNIRILTTPLQETTKIAQKVTREDNFDLQAPVTSENEIGLLTEALNQLILRVKQLLIEQKMAEAKLVQSEKMSGLGNLVSGVAHEINNPVSFIYGNIAHAREYNQSLIRLIGAYQDEYPNPPLNIQEMIEEIDLEFLREDAEELFQSMSLGADRIKTIVNSLRNFSRVDEAEIKDVDIHEGIESASIILTNRLMPDSDLFPIAVIKNYGDLPAVECYPSQLNQVILNLLVNAIDAIEVKWQNTDSYLGQIEITTQKIDGGLISIRIADNGCGMKEEDLKNIFDPFFTTKKIGKGTGLGLFISYQVVTDMHHGKLECHSEPNKGTEFEIAIPIKHSPAPETVS